MTSVEKLSDLLREKGLVLSTAESCTGGMIAAEITSLSGSSDIFDRGFVSYSNDAKIQLLGVSPDIIEKHGAVSAECAAKMVSGALKNSNATIALSITGIAGPTGGTPEKPVGLVYIGVCQTGQEPQIEECFFKGSRDEIRENALSKGISLLIEAALTV